ncbi:anaphase-promoting complex subunit cdc27 [Entomortierella lignicola]|nr:anaphase-promoting complex subunit cdc27 [Entomortierella lignicola]
MAVMATSATESTGFFQTTGQNTIPKLDAVSQRLENIIKFSLEKFQFRNAIFLAERLLSHSRGPGHSEAEREYAQYLLATCHYRQGRPEMAWTVLEGCISSRCRFLFAQCCLDLRRYVECSGVLEWLLEDNTLPRCLVTDIISSRYADGNGEPDRASVLNLMGHTARAQHRHKLAIKYFQGALELNPFLWEAFEGLCELGAPLDPNIMFAQFDTRTTNILPRSLLTFHRPRVIVMDSPTFPSSTRHDTMQGDNMESTFADSSKNNIFPAQELFDSAKVRAKKTIAPSLSNISLLSQASSIDQESTEKIYQPLPSQSESTNKVQLKRGTATNARRQFERTKSSTALHSHTATGGIGKRPLERSSSVAGYATSSVLRGSRARTHSKVGSTFGLKKELSNNEDHDQLQQGATSSTVLPSTDTEPWVEEEGLQIIIDIFRILSRAIGLLSLNKFSDSVAEFESLPFEHLQSGWVQCQLGKCKFGMVDYISAVKYFERARELEPNLHKDMEIYSTTLWHLQKETMLSTLAKELKDSNHHSPQAWVALGNAYSLKRDHDQALKCFRRAVQLNDRFAYAHALSGHEYTDLEEYDKAQTEFRIAMSIEPRNYHAWFGMGLIYDKMGKHDLALIHYKEAHKINPSSSVSLYRVGTSQEKMSRITEALRTFEEAITLEPTNVAARFSKAKIQADMGQYKEALKELEVIIQYSPNEPKVFVLQGKVLSKMGNKEQALKYLTWALNLDRKSSHTIRDIIEKVDQNIDNEEERYEVKVDVDL